MAILVEHPGMLTTVQDLGRPHLRRLGFPSGGGVDANAIRIANWLVGNDENAGVLECALVGPILRVKHYCVLAITGARVAGVAGYERLQVAAGTRLDLSTFQLGSYAYLALSGGINVPVVLNSRSTDLRLQFGGYGGRALHAGDVVTAATPPTTARQATALRIQPVPPDDDAPIRVVDGKDAARVDPAWSDGAYVASSTSDRMGVRLAGPAIACRSSEDAESAVVLPGTIQLPADGKPIVLLADAQTLGGYPQIGHVIAADIGRIAQIRLGRPVRFRRVSLAEAHRAAVRQDRALAFLRYGIRQRIAGDGGH